MQQLEQEVRQFIVDNFVFENGNGSFSSDDRSSRLASWIP